MKTVGRLSFLCTALLAISYVASIDAQSNSIVISQFRVRGPLGGGDEFIELHNLSSAPVNVSGWRVRASNASGTVGDRRVLAAGTIINPGCYFLMVNISANGYSAGVAGDATFTTGVADDGGIAITMPNGVPVDQVGMSTGSFYREGTPVLNLGTTNQNRGYERKPGGTAGHADTNNNALDFQMLAPSAPRNSSSRCVGDEPEIIHLPHDVQGTGTVSPLLGETVTVEGVVTARRGHGFFLQTRAGLDDADPASSEGLFVFTSSAPPAAAAVGTLVRATGSVGEASADGAGQTTTQLAGAVTVVAMGSAERPAPVALGTSDLSPTGSFQQLEHLEGMLVSVASLTSVSGTGGAYDAATGGEASGVVNSTGVFYAVLTGTPRPMREPGPDTPNAASFANQCASGPPCDIPVFDRNPERLRVDSAALGAPPLEVTTGVVIENVTAIVDSGYLAWTLLPVPGVSPSPSVGPNVSAMGVTPPAPGQFTVASLNLERLFDTTDDSSVGDVVLSAAHYARRLAKASLTVRAALQMPDVISVLEVENLGVLQDLAARVNSDAGMAGEYRAYLLEGNDPSGIDVGFLVRSRVRVSSVTQEGQSLTFVDPDDGSVDVLHDRPPLVLRATVDGPSTRLDAPIIVVALHLRSVHGVDAASSARVRVKRQLQAEHVANLLDNLQEQGAVITVGDFNAGENDGLVDVLGTVRGTPAAPNTVVLASPDLVEPDFAVATGGSYSCVFEGNTEGMDHVLLSSAAQTLFQGALFARVNADFPARLANDATRVERSSDHDPAVVYFNFPPDVTPPTIHSIAPSTTRISPPNHRMVPVTFTVTASDNLGVSQCSLTGIASSEPVSGPGPDWTIDGPLAAQLRATRTGQGTGRVYTVTITCQDVAGNTSSATTEVVVAHDQRRVR